MYEKLLISSVRFQKRKYVLLHSYRILRFSNNYSRYESMVEFSLTNMPRIQKAFWLYTLYNMFNCSRFMKTVYSLEMLVWFLLKLIFTEHHTRSSRRRKSENVISYDQCQPTKQPFAKNRSRAGDQSNIHSTIMVWSTFITFIVSLKPSFASDLNLVFPIDCYMYCCIHMSTSLL